MFRSIALSTAVVLATTACVQAGPVAFSDGTTSTSNFAGFDPSPGNVLNVGVTTAANNFNTGGDPTFTAFGQANISTLLTGSGGVALPGGYSFVFALPERITAVTGPVGGFGSSVQFAFNQSASPTAPNYFEVFKVGGTGGSDLAGNGFNGNANQLVLAGKFTGTTNLGNVSNQMDPASALDQFLTNNYTNNQSLTSSGGTTLSGVITYANPNFFTPSPGETLLGGTISFRTDLADPFRNVDPSARFLSNTTTTSIGFTPQLGGAGLGTQTTGLGIGSVNGQNGASTQVEQDARITLVNVVPGALKVVRMLSVTASGPGLIYVPLGWTVHPKLGVSGGAQAKALDLSRPEAVGTA